MTKQMQNLNYHTITFLWLLINLIGCGGLGGHVDNYACNINNQGYCIFTGTPHNLDPSATTFGFEVIVDADGTIINPQGKPFQDGYTLTSALEQITDPDYLAYVEVFKIMAPIRDALMYDIDALDEETWATVSRPLKENGIKLESKHLDSTDRRAWEYGIDDIYHLAKSPNDKDIHHEVMKFLEESELALKCQWLTIDLTNPEGINPC